MADCVAAMGSQRIFQPSRYNLHTPITASKTYTQMNSIVLAFQLLSIIPIPCQFIASDKEVSNACLYYPLVGFCLGGILMVTAMLLSSSLTLNVLAALILIVWVLFTGALHVDGLADCADAWVGGIGSRERSLEIMKDPASGPVAVVVLVLLLLLKWSLIQSLLQQQQFIYLLFSPILGRLAILILMLTTDYVRPAGMAATMIKFFPVNVAIVLTVVLVLLSQYAIGLSPLLLMLGLLWLIAVQAKKRLGGVTGDVYGASVELVEVAVLAGSVL